jgi:hypothetical protein
METFKDIDAFIIETFPLEYEKIIKQRKTSIEQSIESADERFKSELEAIIKGGKKDETA